MVLTRSATLDSGQLVVSNLWPTADKCVQLVTVQCAPVSAATYCGPVGLRGGLTEAGFTWVELKVGGVNCDYS